MTNNTMNTIRPDQDLIRRRELALQKAVTITVPYNKFCKVQDFSKQWGNNKRSVGKHYSADIDGMDLDQRSESGTLVEAAVEELLQVEFIDWDPTFSLKKDKPDLEPIGIDFGIKGGKFPFATIINTDTLYPQIIGIINKDNPQQVHILGAFSKKVLNNSDFRSDSLKINSQLYYKKSKTGFFGLDLGHKLTGMQDLLKYTGDLWLTENREKYQRIVSHVNKSKYEFV